MSRCERLQGGVWAAALCVAGALVAGAGPALAERSDPLLSSKDSELALPPELRGEPASDEASAAAPAAEPDAAMDAEVARIVAYIEALGPTKGRFAQISPDGGLATGAFYLKRPGRIRFDYDPPSPTLVVADGVRVVVQDRDLETTDGYPIGATPLKFLLGAEIDRADFRVLDVRRQPGFVSVTVASKDEETPGSLTLTFAEPVLELRQWTIVDAQGLQTTVSFSDLTQVARLDPALFVVRDTRRFLDSDSARPR